VGVGIRRDRKGLVLRPLLYMREVRSRRSQLLAASVGVFRLDRKGLVLRPLLYMREVRNRHSHLLAASMGVLRRHPEMVGV
jgi:non-homologous end joining protein Ku